VINSHIHRENSTAASCDFKTHLDFTILTPFCIQSIPIFKWLKRGIVSKPMKFNRNGFDILLILRLHEQLKIEIHVLSRGKRLLDVYRNFVGTQITSQLLVIDSIILNRNNFIISPMSFNFYAYYCISFG
jgi:hypothetical protein